MIKKITYKGTSVTARSYRAGDLPEALQRRCACCRRKVNDCDAVLLANNYQHIPNVLMHKTCFMRWEGQEDWLCEEIEERYVKWQEEDEVFGTRIGKQQKEGQEG